MPRVRLIVGMNIAGETREAGEEVNVPGDVASYLREMGRVEIVRGERPETPEAGAGVEHTSARPAGRKSRKSVETREEASRADRGSARTGSVPSAG